MTDPMIGKTVGGCRIIKKLGEGGMGVAYQAHHTRLDRVVVIKFLYPKVAARPGAIESFQLEAKAAARLEHPRITQVYDVGSENNLHYIVMQFIDGETAEDLLVRSGKVDAMRCLQIIQASLEGLQEAHRHGIVHRDIKPSNILLSKDGAIRLADFGLALKTDPSGKAQSAEIIGTPYYMAPEQIYGQAVDGRCDIYAMGATYFHMLTGQPPFQGPTPQDIVSMHCNNPVPDVREFTPSASPLCAEVIMKMMAKKPDDRYRDVSSLLLALNSPGIVAMDPNDMMVGGQMLDIGVVTRPPGGAAPPPVPVPAPGGMTPTLRTPLPAMVPEGPTDEEMLLGGNEPLPQEEPQYDVNPIGWKPITSALLWLITGASAFGAALLGKVYYLGATAVMVFASAGTAPAGLGLTSVLLLGSGIAMLYGAGVDGTIPDQNSLAAAGRAAFLPAAVFGQLALMRLSSQARKSVLTIAAIMFFCVLTPCAAFMFALPEGLAWQVLLDAQARHPRALPLAAAGACLFLLVIVKNRSLRPLDAAPIATTLFALLGAVSLFFAGAANLPEKQADDSFKKNIAAHVTRNNASKQMLEGNLDVGGDDAPMPGQTEKTTHVMFNENGETVVVEVEETVKKPPPPKKSEPEAAPETEKTDTKSVFRKMADTPFEGLRKKLAGSGALLPFGLLFLLYGAFIFWEDARIFQQEKA